MNVDECLPSESFELRFASLFIEGRGLAFPCDERGRVNLESLTPRARTNYFYARAMVGRDYSMPRVQHPCAATNLLLQFPVRAPGHGTAVGIF